MLWRKFGLIVATVAYFSVQTVEVQAFSGSPIEEINVKILMEMPAQSILRLTNYVDLSPFVGYQVQSMKIHGSVFNGATNIDVFYDQGPISYSNRLANFNQTIDVDLLKHPTIVDHGEFFLRNTAPVEIYDMTIQLEKP